MNLGTEWTWLKSRLITVVILGFLAVRTIGASLFGSIWGTFALSIALYWFLYAFDYVNVFGWRELLGWFAALDAGYKTAIGSSLITVLGFLIAFQTATRNWKDQLRASIQLSAAAELTKLYNDASSLTYDISNYAQRVLAAIHVIEQSGGVVTDDVRFQVWYVNSLTPKYVSDRDALSKIAVAVHAPVGRYGSYVARYFGLPQALQRTNRTVGEISQASWFPIFSVPQLAVEHIDAGLVKIFVANNDRRRCEQFLEATKAIGYVQGRSGITRGVLESVVVTPNILSVWYLTRNFRGVAEFVAMLRQRDADLKAAERRESEKQTENWL